MIIASFVESISIGAVFPLLTALTKPEIIFQSHLGGMAMTALGITSPADALLPTAIIFGVSIFISGCIRLLLMWVGTRYAFALGADLNCQAYKKTLYQPYEVHISRNSSEVINGILGKVNGIPQNIIIPILNLISSLFLIILIFIVLLYIDIAVAITTFFLFGTIYLFMALLVRRRLKINSEKIAFYSSKVMQLLNEGLGGIRDVLIDGSQRLYSDLYSSADLSLRRSQASNTFIGSSPRAIVETIGVIFITALAYIISNSNTGSSGGISVVGTLALGAQRMLPSLQQIYSSWAYIKGSEKSLEDSLELLGQPTFLSTGNEDKKISFSQTISLENIFFEYKKNTQPVINDLSIKIKN
jgi:ATP-binding cassette subfamily B protein